MNDQASSPFIIGSHATGYDNQTPALFNIHPQSTPPSTSIFSMPKQASAPAFVQSADLRQSLDCQNASPPLPPLPQKPIPSTIFQQNPAIPFPHSAGLIVSGDAEQTMEQRYGHIIAHLKEEVAQRDKTISLLVDEIERLRQTVGDRNRDVDQLKSVLDQKDEPISSSGQTTSYTVSMDGVQILETLLEGTSEAGDGLVELSKMPTPHTSAIPRGYSAATRVKKQGVSGESVSRSNNIGFIHYEKDESSRHLIFNAIDKNEFLNNLERGQIEEIVLCMHEKRVSKDCYIIREGEPGDALYVSAEGTLEVTKGDQIIGQMQVGKAFGEMALLYNCNRTASVRALTDAKFWMLDRRVYQQIMMNSSVYKHKENFRFLKSVSDFRNLSRCKQHKLADVLELIYYPANEYIIRQGEVGETFFIIHSGRVQITQSKCVGGPPKDIRVLVSGQWFGERALYTLEKRSANAIALPPGVHVLCLDKSNFTNLIGDLREIKTKEYADCSIGGVNHSPGIGYDFYIGCGVGDKRHSSVSQLSGDEDMASALPVFSKKGAVVDGHGVTVTTVGSTGAATTFSRPSTGLQTIRYEDLIPKAILGIGGFGRVELVVWRHDQKRSFALKCMKKQHIVETRQQEHIFSERNLMFEIASPFVCRLYATYRDSKYVYMLLEACLGGELWTILRNRGHFDEHITRFVVASVLEAFTYLHAHHIIYRDLKPENLLLDERGYIKLCDFGFAKKIASGNKTWTFCGTPEYVAPEIVLNKGHDHSADYWSLGILIYELLTGSPPFTETDPMKIYSIILRGINAILFPAHQINRTAHALIQRLCAQNPVERLGYGRGGIVDIKQHKYFQGFDWIGLCRGTLTAPILPKISGPTDVSNFDRYPDQVDIPPDELSGWDAEF